MLFSGTYRQSLDDKNRIRVPAKIRQGLGAGYVLMRGYSGSLFVLPSETFKSISESLMSVKLSDVKGQMKVRKLLSTVIEPEEDSQGRFVLPQELKKLAGIEKRVVFVGMGNRIELWSEDSFDAFNDSDDSDAAYEGLSEYGI